MSSKLWRNAFVYFLILVALLALSHSAQSAKIAAGFLSVFDVAALIAYVVAVLVLLFSGAEGEQKLSRQLRSFCLLSGWSLAYYWPSDARLYTHVVVALVCAGACYLLLRASGVKRTLILMENRGSIRYVLAVFCVNLLLVPIILVWHFSPFSTHAAAQEGVWVWHALFPAFRFALWATAAVAMLIWSFTRLARNGRMAYVASILTVCLVALILSYRAGLPVVRQVSLDSLARQINAGEVQSLVIAGNRLRARTANGEVVASKENGSSALQTLRNLGISDQELRAITIEVGQVGFGERYGSALLVTGGLLLVAAAMVWALVAVARSNRVYNDRFTSALPPIRSDGEPPKVTFKDVGGATEAKEALQDIIQFLKEPQAFLALGARMPKGILLEGPPGTGKTLLAQAVAGEAGVPFFYMSGSQFVEMFVGVGASRVRDLFAKAEKAAPSLVFIDELDAVGQRREGSLRSNQENSQTLNQLLTELDGFEANTQVVVIAATNRADILDEALTRPGRFDRRIHVDPPTREEREAILRIHLKGKPLSINDDEMSELSRQAYDMTGADLATVANQSAIIAAKARNGTIQTDHLAAAMKQSGAMMPDAQAPALMVESISQAVVGQESAIRAVASAIYQHYSDLRTIGENGGGYTTKPNVLLCGPPGTGKSLILRTLAQHLQVPFATVDASAIVNNPDNIRVALGRLLTAANNDLRRVKYGIVCIYGIEDLLAPGLAYVQEALGRIIEGATFDITRHEHSFNSKDVSLSTEHMIFICEGTFALPGDLIRTFSGSVSQHRHDRLVALGFRPSLLGKFQVIASTEELSADQLLQILSEGEYAPLRQYQRRFAGIGTELRFEHGAHHQIVSEARSRKEGARCLGHILEEVLQDYLYSEHPQKEVVITGSLICDALGVEIPLAPRHHDEVETTSEKPDQGAEAAPDLRLSRSLEPPPAPSAPEVGGSLRPTGLPQMEIELERQKDGNVQVVHNGRLSHSFDPNELAAGANAAPPSAAYAAKMYQCLFAPGTSMEEDLDSGPKRISLVTTDPALQEIPWEYACGPSGLVVLKNHFVRGLPAGQRIAPPVLDRALHIIAVPATPLSGGVPALNVEGEWLRLRDIIQEVPGAIHLERTYPPTLERLRNLVANRQGGIVHFMGHGKKGANENAVLCFENDYGGLTEVTAQDFVQRMNRTVFMVCLNACVTAQPGPTEFSNLAAALAARQIPYTLGMRSRMDDADALTFARVLYGELARGSSVEEAVMQARQELAASPNAEAAGVPVLYTSLASPAQGFPQLPGAATIDEHRPPMELNAIHRAEGSFQGRVDELKEIGKRLTGDQRTPILTVHGAGGQGKTALVRAAVERFAHAWPGGVWAISLESLPSRATFSRSLARFLGIPEEGQTDLAAVERQTLARLDQRRTLVVLDNAETLVEAVDHQDPEALELAQFIRQDLPRQNVSLLITSRVLMGWGEEHLELGGLDPQAGASVFLQSMPRKIGVDGWQSAASYTVNTLATHLSEKLEGCPLGLFLLGKAYHASGKPLAEFVEEFESVLLEAGDRYLEDSHRHRTIYACIDASVRSLDDDLRGLLAKLWIFHASFLPEVAVAVLGSQPLFDSYEFRGTLMDIGAPIDLAEEAPNQYTPIYNKMNTDWDFGENTAIYAQLDTLWQRGLLERNVYTIGDQREASRALLYRLLPTIRSYLKTTFDPEGAESQPLLARLGEAYAVLIRELAAEISSNPLKVTIVEQSLEDLERGLTYATGKAKLDYLSDLSGILGRFGYRQKSLDLASEARRLAEILEPAPQNPRRPRSVPEEVENQLQAMETDALARFDAGQPEKALTVLQQVLSLSRKYDQRSNEANALYSIGHAYQALGQSQEALTAFRQALVLLEKDKDRVAEAKALNGLGLVYLTGLGDHRKALDHFRKARRAWERKDSSAFEQPDQGALASILNNLGETYRQMGKTAEAVDLFQQALPLLQAVRDPLEAVTLYNLAHIFRKTGKSQLADQFCEQALTASLKVGNRAVEAAVYVDMAQRQPQERAENLLRKACKIYRETGQAAFEASALASLAMTLEGRSKGRKEAIDEAVTLAQHSVRLLEDNHLPQDAGGGKLSQHHDLLKRLLTAQKKG